MDQQGPQVSIAPFTDAEEAVSTATRPLLGHETEPGGDGGGAAGIAVDPPAAAALSAALEADANARAEARGFDWLNLFIANIQTKSGPFVAVSLTAEGWTQTAIGTVPAMASQVPAGALVDAVGGTGGSRSPNQ